MGFQLTRIPTSIPRFFRTCAKEDDAIVALELGPSGRGLRVDAHGAVYRGAPTDFILSYPLQSSSFPPAIDSRLVNGQGGPSAPRTVNDGASDGGACSGFGRAKRLSKTAKTVDFWPYRRLESVPDEVLRSDFSTGGVRHNDRDGSKLLVRFDEGMGRMVALRIRKSAGGDESGETLVSVLDFA